MKNKPSPIRHMITWGAMSGGVLAIVYSLMILTFAVPDYLSKVFLIMLVSMLAYAQGGVLGGMLGAIEGLILKFFLRDMSPQFAKDEIKSKRKWVYLAMFAVPFLLQLILIMPALISNGFVFADLPLHDTYLRDIGIPLMIASLASTYAVHHYLKHLQRWSESLDARKAKVEPDVIVRLAEHPQQEEIMLHEREILEQRSIR